MNELVKHLPINQFINQSISKSVKKIVKQIISPDQSIFLNLSNKIYLAETKLKKKFYNPYIQELTGCNCQQLKKTDFARVTVETLIFSKMCLTCLILIIPLC